MINRFWLLLLTYLSLCAVGDGDDAGDDPNLASDGADGDEGGDNDGDEGDDVTLDDVAGDDDGEGQRRQQEDPPGRTQTELRAARRRADTAERELEIERAATRRNTPPADTRPTVDPMVAQEDAYIERIRAAGDETATAQAVWYVDQNRRQRQTQQTADRALRAAEDLSDRTTFISSTKPEILKKYGQAVERALADTRARGQNAPRGAILRLLIGNDILDGKVTPRAKRNQSSKTGDAGGVNRGRTPGARSDTRGGGQSNRDKLRAKLENQLI